MDDLGLVEADYGFREGIVPRVSPDVEAEVWGVLYKITRNDLLWLDYTEGVPGRRYRHLWVEAEDREGNRMPCVTYIAEGKETDGHPSLRYIMLLREGVVGDAAIALEDLGLAIERQMIAILRDQHMGE